MKLPCCDVMDMYVGKGISITAVPPLCTGAQVYCRYSSGDYPGLLSSETKAITHYTSFANKRVKAWGNATTTTAKTTEADNKNTLKRIVQNKLSYRIIQRSPRKPQWELIAVAHLVSLT